MNSPITRDVIISRVEDAAVGIKVYEFVDPEGRDLPTFTAGAHIDVHLPNAMVRAYSLVNSPAERNRYVVAVQLAESGRGGSRQIHDTLKSGDRILVAAPRNHFELDETCSHSCLIAGGIGVTPMLAMARRLTDLGHSWDFHYAARTRQHAVFAAELRDLAEKSGNALHCYFDQEPAGSRIGLAAVVEQSPEDATLYCCGPAQMLTVFETLAQSFNRRARVERFAASEQAALSGGFSVILNRSRLTIPVAPGTSILDAVCDAGVSVTSSCKEGICGACETRVLQGIPDHRDALLSEDERASNSMMMICCSGSKTETLVLDL